MLNIDTDEVQKFDNMAADWWDPQGPCKPLHQLNPVRLHFIQTQCNLHEKTILDVGCGGGILTEALSRFSAQVIGLDQSEQALKIAQAHAQAEGLHPAPQYIHATAEAYAEQHPQRFSVITCMELLEHVPDPASLLKALDTLLKPEGDLFISTLNRTPKAFLQAIIGAEYCLRLLPIGTHDYHRFIKPSEIAEWIKNGDLTIQAIRGMKYHVLTKTFSLSRNVDVNYVMHLKKRAPLG